MAKKDSKVVAGEIPMINENYFYLFTKLSLVWAQGQKYRAPSEYQTYYLRFFSQDQNLLTHTMSLWKLSLIIDWC